MFWNAGILPVKYADRDVRVPGNKAGTMNKLLLFLMIMSVLCMLNATTLEVSLDGTHPYTTIQSAVYASSNGDTVLVHPGRYIENIDFIGKSITVSSDYLNNPDWSIVESTIIDGNQESSCVIAIDYEIDARLNGFSLTNGYGYDDIRFGGGIFQKRQSVLSVSNCLIVGNEGLNGGGIYTGNNCITYLSGSIIKNNQSSRSGGGLSINTSNINFDPVNINSIFNNYGNIQDIYIYNSVCNDIVLDTLSVDISAPDGYFVSYNHYSEPAPSISSNNHYITQVDSDLFVSPVGDDSNDGLTPETALKTIAYATRIIQPNEVNPNTVFLLPGIYSKELNNQFFPVAVQSHTKLLGAGEASSEVIIGDEWNNNTISVWYAEHVDVGNFHIRKNNMYDNYTLSVNECEDIIIRDIDFGEAQTNKPGLTVSQSIDIELSNCSFHDIVGNYRFKCVKTYLSKVTLNNVLLHDNNSNSSNGYVSCLDFDDSTITANNIIVANNYQDYPGGLVQYSNTANNSIGENLNLSNFLMYNNTSTSSILPMLIFFNRYDPSYISNMTIVHNIGTNQVLRLAGDYTIRNSILYNPNAGPELNIWEPSSGDSNPTYSNVDADYNLIRGGISSINGADNPNNTLTWGPHNIDTDPLFRGDVYGDVELEDIRWVQLTENSPCVNAGTPDTLGMNLPPIDITGNPRVWDNIIDMGAYEYNATPNSDETAPTPPTTIQVSHFPNPVTPNGSNGKVAFIEFTLPNKPIEKPTLEIYNIKGQKVRSIKITQSFSALVRSARLSAEEKQSGEMYSQIWDCKDDNRKLVGSGIYFYKVSSEGEEAIGKMMVIK